MMVCVFLAIFWLFMKRPNYYFYLLRKTSIFIIYCWNITTTSKTENKTILCSEIVQYFMVPKSKPPTPSLLYLNNVYYIIHIFCRLFFCVFFSISTHFFLKITITLYYSAIYFLATLLLLYYCIHFYLIMWVFLA